MMTNSRRFEKIQFDSDSRLINYYFGKEKKRKLDYNEFCHFMKEFRDDYLHEAFKHVDVNGSGYIPCSEFVRIAVTMRGHIIPSTVNKYFGMVRGVPTTIVLNNKSHTPPCRYAVKVMVMKTR